LRQKLSKQLKSMFLGGLCCLAAKTTSAEVRDNVEAAWVCLPPARASLTPELRRRIAAWLGWQDSTETELDKAGNICRGNYHEPLLEGYSEELSKKDDTRISADEAELLTEGRSTLKGNVVVVQPEKEMMADTAYIYRDPKTHQITKIELFGHVYFKEPGRLVIGDKGYYLPQTESGDLENILYRLTLPQPVRLEGDQKMQAWGRASSVKREGERYFLNDASYTTCPPKDSSWMIKARKIKLDKITGRGTAKDGFLEVNNFPVFYFPYYNFPIDDRRKTGFLTPVLGYSDNSGAQVGVPFYWNIAPNYDLLLTPNYYSQRGVLLNSDFRYLTPISKGELELSGILHDKAFSDFVNDNQDQLGNLSDDRYEIYFNHVTQFNQNWSVDAIYHEVSDDYYLQDFGSTIAETTENQLLRQLDLNYNSENWSSIGRLQHYQTLHPINQTAVDDVYSRYPQWILNGHYDDLPDDFNFAINNEFDSFVWTGADEETVPLGERYHTNPILTRPVFEDWGYIKPTVQLQETYYGLSQNPNNLSESINVAVPQISLDNGVYFDRDTQILGKSWVQTLEPRLYYLYVPYVDQTEVPVFDSSYYTFTYDQLFRPDRFTGLDRVGDANQVSLALMSRFMDPETGSEVFHFGVGETYYFQDRKVQLMQLQDPNAVYADDPDTTPGYYSDTTAYSPIASQLAYYFNPVFSITGDGAWDPHTQAANNAAITLHYQPGTNKIINAGYSYLVNGDETGITDPGMENGNLDQISIAYAWPFSSSSRWSSFGSWSQNISHDYPMNYFLGVQYENCCWAVRLLGGKMYTNLDNNNDPVYSDSVYLQILLKGLGTVANGKPTAMTRSIPGYQDIFR